MKKGKLLCKPLSKRVAIYCIYHKPYLLHFYELHMENLLNLLMDKNFLAKLGENCLTKLNYTPTSAGV